MGWFSELALWAFGVFKTLFDPFVREGTNLLFSSSTVNTGVIRE